MAPVLAAAQALVPALVAAPVLAVAQVPALAPATELAKAINVVRMMLRFPAICSVKLSFLALVMLFNALSFVRNSNHVVLIKNIAILLRKRLLI
ncbi:hypothetical protein ALO62_200025 [Pseudomonas amygdali pv. myricae]|nr:hypothetical protein ALO62_200025 [Pseudomonas amygdali pv. myricae]